VQAAELKDAQHRKGRETKRGNIASRVPAANFANNTRTFLCGLKTVTAQCRHMNKNITVAVLIGNDKTIALRDVEPFNGAGNLDNIGCILSGVGTIHKLMGQRLVSHGTLLLSSAGQIRLILIFKITLP